MEIEETVSIRMYCPNCGAKVAGFKIYDNAIRTTCSRCTARIFRRQKSKHKLYIKLLIKL